MGGLLGEVAGSYEWTLEQRRQIAVSKLRESAKDWHILDGVGAVDWGDDLTLDQWVTLVQARVRRDGETLRQYCYEKLKICRRCPAMLDEHAVIRYLTLGLRNEQAEGIVLAAKPRNLQSFFETIKEWEGYFMDRRPAPPLQSNGPPAVPAPEPLQRSTQDPPDSDRFDLLIKEIRAAIGATQRQP